MIYSIVTCMYNAEKHIKQYFDNLNKIEYDDFEVIIVDDASSDNSLMMLKKYTQESTLSIKIISQQVNKGPGSARNAGLQNAIGDKILFLDVDDYFDHEVLKKLEKYLQYDCVYFDYFKQFKNGMIKHCNSLTRKEHRTTDIDYVMKSTTGCVWGKLFTRKIIIAENIEFPSLYKSEDIVFMIRYLLHCTSIYYLKEALYYYVISNDSLMNTDIGNQIVYAEEAMRFLKKDLYRHMEVYQVLHSKEIIYDITNIYIQLGYKRKFVFNFWNKNKLNWNFITEWHVFTTVQFIGLLMIKLRSFYIWRTIVLFKKRFLSEVQKGLRS